MRRKLAHLREECPPLRGHLQAALMINIQSDSESEAFTIGTDWLSDIEASEPDAELLDLVLDQFSDRFVFERHRRIIGQDELVEDREFHRIRLSKEQIKIATSEYVPSLWVAGPAGSGKTLILVARAIDMAKSHPNWNIQIVAFNQSLKRYFENELTDYKNISVSSFGEFSRARNATFRFYRRVGNEQISVGEKEAQGNLYTARQAGIAQDVDALFIDEIQDFFPSWIEYCYECIRPGNGGMTVVGDEEQAIFREARLEQTLSQFDSKKIVLTKAYRSTQEIMQVVNLLLDQEQNMDLEFAPHGPKPELIFVDVEKKKSDSLNSAMIQDVLSLLKNDQLSAGDIAILSTTNYYRLNLVGRLREELKAELRYDVLVDGIERHSAHELDMSRDSIKVTTIYNAKGLEFPVVILLGLEDLDKHLESEDENERKRILRLNLVGPSRAKDRLLIYYTKQNSFTHRLRDHSETVNFRSYPEDYEGRA